ncbi:carbohydrate ABC transporter substrate-binding protein (CUT1 family) [Tamaricihabitans halophyticus]|uniref:Carbohydrate ABC transporter substrate-binding protein (CUT1 family) n=1 Tax=Tamaricihabitans halophyticus TaxID=1262583 RepID=A0A4R2Q4Y3_9PSEU|nr:extracellular solute-binding protein [Tamaricihabitans halophyticus]TCP43873.1 carbohydrate ABC transporter substrate-binding protein (CUT1 family) [Tamaricihabitans halophyticus]
MTRASFIPGLIAASALVIAGCGTEVTQQQDPNLASTNPDAVTGTVTFWDTSDATIEAPAVKEVVNRFEREYPNITVNYTSVPFDGAADKFRTAAQSGDGAPDVFRTDVGWTATFAALGYLQPLDGTPALADQDDLLPTTLASAKWNGKTYGSPQVTDSLALVYNKKLLAEAGIDEPPRTWSELRGSAQTIEREIPGTTGFFAHADGYYLLPFLYGQGSDVVDVDGERITIDSPQMRAAIDTARELTKDGTGATDTSANGYTNMQNGFKSGEIAMALNGPWAITDIFTGSAFQNQDNLGIAEVPAGPSTGAGPIGGHNLTVYAGSANLAAAYLFVEFLNSPENQAYIASRNNTMPTRESAYDHELIADNQVLDAFRAPLDNALARPSVPGAGDLYDLITPYYQKILRDPASTDDSLAQVQRKSLDYVPGFEG